MAHAGRSPDRPDPRPMPSASPDTIHPDPVDALPSDFRIEGSLAVRGILRDLAQRHVLVTLYADEHLADFAVSQVLRAAGAEVDFDLSGQEPFAHALAHARRVVGVAFPGPGEAGLWRGRVAGGSGDRGRALVSRRRAAARLRRSAAGR